MAEDISTIVVTGVGVTPNPVSAGGPLMVSVSIKEMQSRVVNVPASAWTGNGPFIVDLTSDIVTVDSELTAYVDCTASTEQRMEEYNAGLRVTTLSAQTVRLMAMNRKPRLAIPVRIQAGPFPRIDTVTIPASSWSGSGPWTATVSLGSTVRTAVVGASEKMNDESARTINGCGIHASGASGSSLMLRAMFDKPTASVTVSVGVL